jgi:hypothetical protein
LMKIQFNKWQCQYHASLSTADGFRYWHLMNTKILGKKIEFMFYCSIL